MKESTCRQISSFVLVLGMLVLGQTASGQTVEALLEQMTLEEKVGQMTQLTLQAVAATEGTPEQKFELDEGALREAIAERHVGSLLNVYNHAMTQEEWASLMGVIDSLTRSESRLGIPVLYGIDAVHGNNYLMGATIFPQNIGLAASWNMDLVAEAARITARESRSVGHTWNFAPVLDVARNPLWSRFFETFGEDPYTVSVLGRTAIEAMQEIGDRGYPLVAATGKHFLGYSAPLSGKDRTPAWIPERMLRDIFLPPFKEAFDAGLLSIMVNSSEINGIPVHADPRLLTTMLRDELEYEGLVVTDWEDIGKLVNMHRVASDYKEAVYQSVSAGIDMAMVPYDYTFTEALIELVQEGRIPEERIDQSVRRILDVKHALGMFDAQPSMIPSPFSVGDESSLAASREAARQSMTLLKNDGLLPNALDGQVLLAGPGAESVPMMFGSWSYTWQGDIPEAYPKDIPTLADELGNRSGALRLAPWGADHDPDRIRAMAYQSDIAILALGERPSVEKPGDIESLDFPLEQVALVKQIAETGVPVVVVLYQNRPRIIREIEPYADAIVLAYLPGPFGAEATVDVLTGVENPAGHLPFTYPRFTGSVVPYDRKFSEQGDILFGWNGYHPQYEFGHGLSYTSFEYSDLQVMASGNSADEVMVSVTITNTGDIAGADVAHLFIGDQVASVTPPVKRLRGFERLELASGESSRVEWKLSRDDFMFIGRDNASTFESGVFVISVDSLMTEITLR